MEMRVNFKRPGRPYMRLTRTVVRETHKNLKSRFLVKRENHLLKRYARSLGGRSKTLDVCSGVNLNPNSMCTNDNVDRNATDERDMIDEDGNPLDDVRNDHCENDVRIEFGISR